MNIIHKTMGGLAAFSDIMRGDKAAIASLLCGNIDDCMRCAIFFTMTEELPATLDFENAVVDEKLKSLKEDVRLAVASSASTIIANERERILAEVSESSKPHPMGTVAELAAKFGVSKSEIRRRKADGTLHELENKQ